MRDIVRVIHEKAVRSAAVIREERHNLIGFIQQIDKIQGYRDFNQPSLWQYCLKELKLDESETSTLITVARKAVEIPELKIAVENKHVTLTNARRIAPVLNSENKTEWIEKARRLSKRDLEKEIASHFPKAATIQRADYVAKNRLQFQSGLDEQTYQELLNAQNLVSQKQQGHADFEMTLKEVLRFYNNANDPVLKAQRARARKAKRDLARQNERFPKTAPIHVPEHVNSSRRHLPADLEHRIDLRDQRQCIAVDEFGGRCTEKKWLEYHHIIPVENGGQDTLENIHTLCRGHHRLIHSVSRTRYPFASPISSRVLDRSHEYRRALPHPANRIGLILVTEFSRPCLTLPAPSPPRPA